MGAAISIRFFSLPWSQLSSGLQTEATLEQQALSHGLMPSNSVCMPGQQFLLLIRHDWHKFSPFLVINLRDSLNVLQADVSYSIGSILPYQNSSKILIPHPPPADQFPENAFRCKGEDAVHRTDSGHLVSGFQCLCGTHSSQSFDTHFVFHNLNLNYMILLHRDSLL